MSVITKEKLNQGHRAGTLLTYSQTKRNVPRLVMRNKCSTWNILRLRIQHWIFIGETAMNFPIVCPHVPRGTWVVWLLGYASWRDPNSCSYVPRGTYWILFPKTTLIKAIEPERRWQITKGWGMYQGLPCEINVPRGWSKGYRFNVKHSLKKLRWTCP
jgi:hypothetical protein